METVTAPDAREVRGVNSQAELAELGSVMRQAKNEELMASGVTIEDPATTYIDRDVRVGPDTVIHPGVTLEGAPWSARGASSGAACASPTRPWGTTSS